MKVVIYIDKVIALNAGNDVYGYKIVEVPAAELSEQQRQLLGKEFAYVYEPHKASADFDISTLSCHSDTKKIFGPLVVEATKETVIALLQAKIEFDHKKEQEAEAKRRAELEILLDQPPQHFLSNTNEYHPVSHKRWFVRNPGHPELAQKMKEAKAIAEQWTAKSLEEAMKDAAEKEAKAKIESEKEKANIAALKNWAAECGSELLKKRIAGNFSWRKIAQKEFTDLVIQSMELQSAVIESDEEGDYEFEELRSPTLEQINALEKVKEVVNECCHEGEHSTKLYKVTEKNYEKTTVEIEVKFTIMDGTTATFWIDPEKV